MVPQAEKILGAPVIPPWNRHDPEMATRVRATHRVSGRLHGGITPAGERIFEQKASSSLSTFSLFLSRSPNLQFSLHSVSLSPRRRRRATSDALAYASAADDASDERGPPLPTSDVRYLPRAVASHKRGPLPPTSEVRLLALASALAPTTPTPTTPLTSEVCLLALTPTPPPTSSALASDADADADDASDERGPLPPKSEFRLHAPTPTPTPPLTSDDLASASALASDADADASGGRVFFCFPSHRLISHRLI
ncbi:hypothetical protein NL676_039129 [Syzygium grande]|nr:hypothetical protein NL676_039129 [Syzygium grande]